MRACPSATLSNWLRKTRFIECAKLKHDYKLISDHLRYPNRRQVSLTFKLSFVNGFLTEQVRETTDTDFTLQSYETIRD
jgi:hypothetical protein